MSCTNNHKCRRCTHPCSTEIRNKEHAKWFTSLTISQKEALTGKLYPECTQVWLDMTRDERENAIAESGIVRKRGNRETALGHDF